MNRASGTLRSQEAFMRTLGQKQLSSWDVHPHAAGWGNQVGVLSPGSPWMDTDYLQELLGGRGQEDRDTCQLLPHGWSARKVASSLTSSSWSWWEVRSVGCDSTLLEVWTWDCGLGGEGLREMGRMTMHFPMWPGSNSGRVEEMW